MKNNEPAITDLTMPYRCAFNHTLQPVHL